MQPVVRVRDVARGQVYDCNPDEPILRGPYDLFRPDGPVQIMQDGLVKWWHAGAEQRARVVPGTLRDALAGQRVLMKLPATLEAEVWWVCEVEAAVGAEAPQASFGRRPAGAKDETR